MLTQRLKILTALIISFILVEGYTYFSQNPGVIPAQAENIKGLLANIKFSPPWTGLDFSLPKKLFTLRFTPSSNNGTIEQLNNSLSNNNSPNNNSYVIPTAKPFTYAQGKPTQPIQQIQPTSPYSQVPSPYVSPDDEPVDFPEEPGAINNLNPIPTNPPYVTKPKPTKVPTLPPITTDLRPGTTLYGIFDEVSKRACFPTALLKAIQYKETGARIKNTLDASTIKTYNTYGWWITGAGDPCFGKGYYEQSGIIPPDSVNAGGSCGPAYGDPTDQKIMGITSISEWEAGVAQKYITGIIPKNDRRVFFDNALMFAFISRSRVGNPPKDCNDWPDDVVKLVAEKHAGNCDYYYTINGVSGNYCTEILNLYKEYRKGK